LFSTLCAEKGMDWRRSNPRKSESIVLKGGDLDDVVGDLWPPTVILLVLATLALLRFRCTWLEHREDVQRTPRLLSLREAAGARDMLRTLKLAAASLILALIASPLAAAQDAPPVWSALADQKFAFHNEGVHIPETATQGDTVISIPVTHLRAAIARQAISDQNTGEALVNAGASGYLAGQFGGEDVWCFQPSSGRSVACFVQRSGIWYATGPANHNFYPTSVQLSALLTRVSPVEIEQGAATASSDLRAEYRLRRWSRRGAEVELLIGRQPVAAGTYRVYQTFARQTDGSALVATPVGLIRLSDAGHGSVSVSNVSVEVR
jgi:hypothetical protein